jgi:rhamnosyltransferase
MLARAHGADVIRIARESFSHGGTRNLLMSEARGEHVAFLTQDAVPESANWLARLLAGFAIAPNVALVFGPYRPRPGASLSVVRELTSWFASFSPDGPRVDSLKANERDLPPSRFLGHLGFFTSANGCVARTAWRQVPFRKIAYAEDHLLAQDMLRAGYAKVYVPDAPVIHSHEYSAAGWMRRNFDEARAVHEVYGWALDHRAAALSFRGGVAGDWRWARTHDEVRRSQLISVLGSSLVYHGARAAGRYLGARADRLPSSVVVRLSLEARV